MEGKFLYAKRLESKGFSVEEASQLSAMIFEQCPWLKTDEEISVEIGVELLRDSLDASLSSVIDTEDLIRFHNSVVQERSAISDSTVEEDPYDDLCNLICRFGVEDAFGDGDYWVVADSFSTPHVSIVQYSGTEVRSDLRGALQDWINEKSSVLTVSVIDEEGDVIFKVARKGA